MAYEIVRYTPEFREPLLGLQQGLWGRFSERNAAYLDWKYLGNPYISEPIIHLALAEGEVVGSRGMFGACWRAGDPSESVVAPCTGDLVIRNRHRGKGIVGQLLDAENELVSTTGFPFALNLSGNHVTQAASLIAGWRSSRPLETAVWHSPGWWAHRLRIGGRSLSALDVVVQVWPPDRRVCVSRTPRPEAMAELVSRVDSDDRIRHCRDSGYYSWRFGNPLSRYRFLYLGDLEGFLVLQMSVRERRGWVNVVDWAVESDEGWVRLVAAAQRLSLFQRLTIWPSGLSESRREHLARAGWEFKRGPVSIARAYREGASKPAILVRSVGAGKLGGRSLLSVPDWDLRGIYSDSF